MKRLGNEIAPCVVTFPLYKYNKSAVSYWFSSVVFSSSTNSSSTLDNFGFAQQDENTQKTIIESEECLRWFEKIFSCIPFHSSTISATRHINKFFVLNGINVLHLSSFERTTINENLTIHI